MYETLSWVRRISQMGTYLMTMIDGRLVAEDERGNKYYESRSGHGKRWVLYAGDLEPSMIPPEWFAWLHGQCDRPLPRGTENGYPWQKEPLANLTGTSAALKPEGCEGTCRCGGKLSPVSSPVAYQPWKPTSS